MVDNTTKAALAAPVVYWRVLLYADFLGDVLRVTHNAAQQQKAVEYDGQ